MMWPLNVFWEKNSGFNMLQCFSIFLIFLGFSRVLGFSSFFKIFATIDRLVLGLLPFPLQKISVKLIKASTGRKRLPELFAH